MASYVWCAERLIPAVYRNVRFEVISPSTGEDLAGRGIAEERIDTVFCGTDHDRFTGRPAAPATIRR